MIETLNRWPVGRQKCSRFADQFRVYAFLISRGRTSGNSHRGPKAPKLPTLIDSLLVLNIASNSSVGSALCDSEEWLVKDPHSPAISVKPCAINQGDSSWKLLALLLPTKYFFRWQANAGIAFSMSASSSIFRCARSMSRAEAAQPLDSCH